MKNYYAHAMAEILQKYPEIEEAHDRTELIREFRSGVTWPISDDVIKKMVDLVALGVEQEPLAVSHDLFHILMDNDHDRFSDAELLLFGKPQWLIEELRNERIRRSGTGSRYTDYLIPYHSHYERQAVFNDDFRWRYFMALVGLLGHFSDDMTSYPKHEYFTQRLVSEATPFLVQSLCKFPDGSESPKITLMTIDKLSEDHSIIFRLLAIIAQNWSLVRSRDDKYWPDPEGHAATLINYIKGFTVVGLIMEEATESGEPKEVTASDGKS